MQFVIQVDLTFISDLKINETPLYFVFSYFIGFIFQEFSSLINNKIFNRNKILLKKALKPSNEFHCLLSLKEKKAVYNYVGEKLKLNESDDIDTIVYNYCKFDLIAKNQTARIDNYKAKSAISRSLSLYFFILFSAFLIRTICENSSMNLLYSVFSFVLSILLYERYIRFMKIRYVYIFRMFYYNIKSINN